jgi:hypothetical protein
VCEEKLSFARRNCVKASHHPCKALSSEYCEVTVRAYLSLDTGKLHVWMWV